MANYLTNSKTLELIVGYLSNKLILNYCIIYSNNEISQHQNNKN